MFSHPYISFFHLLVNGFSVTCFRTLFSRGVGTAAAAAAMAAAHSRPRKRAGQLYSINAHAQVYDFPAGSESSSIWTRPVFQEAQ